MATRCTLQVARLLGLASLFVFATSAVPAQEQIPQPRKIEGQPAVKEACPRPPCPWAGIYPTVVTPWLSCGRVDCASLAAQIRRELHGGVHGLLLLGTIGEGQYANMDERAQVITTAVRVTQGCVPIVVGIHTCNVEVAKAQIRQAKQLGAQAVLVKHVGQPFALFCQVLAFYEELSAMNCLPIFYYHYPSQTGLAFRPDQIAQILALPGVIGIKESTLDLKQTMQHMAYVHGMGKVFLSGTALNLTQFLGIGGHGAMCPEAVLLPAKTVHAYEAWVTGHKAEARAIQDELFVVAPILSGGVTTEAMARRIVSCTQDRLIALPMQPSDPQARMKVALNALCIITAPLVKCPVTQLTRFDQHAVHRAIKRIKKMQHGPAPACCVPPYVPVVPDPAQLEVPHSLLPPVEK